MSITIYSTTTCGFCKMLKHYLDENKQPYVEKLADTDESIARELFEKSHQFAVPFTIIKKDDGSEQTILGFNRQEVDAALGLA